MAIGFWQRVNGLGGAVEIESDHLVFVSVIAEAVVGTDGLEVVDEGDGLDLELAGGHGVDAEMKNLKRKGAKVAKGRGGEE